MADTTVETEVLSNNDAYPSPWGPYWIDASTAVVIYIDSSADLYFSRTTDKGASWTETSIFTGTIVKVAAWFDKETPGDAGTLVHIAYIADTVDDAYYRILDVSDGSLDTQRTVDSGITAAGAPNDNRLSITKTKSNNIIYAFSTQTEIECYRSTDLFVTSNDNRADVFEAANAEDYVLLYPAATADDDDAVAIFWDPPCVPAHPAIVPDTAS